MELDTNRRIGTDPKALEAAGIGHQTSSAKKSTRAVRQDAEERASVENNQENRTESALVPVNLDAEDHSVEDDQSAETASNSNASLGRGQRTKTPTAKAT